MTISLQSGYVDGYHSSKRRMERGMNQIDGRFKIKREIFGHTEFSARACCSVRYIEMKHLVPSISLAPHRDTQAVAEEFFRVLFTIYVQHELIECRVRLICLAFFNPMCEWWIQHHSKLVGFSAILLSNIQSHESMTNLVHVATGTTPTKALLHRIRQ